MDPFKLLSRSTKLAKGHSRNAVQSTPSCGVVVQPHSVAQSNSDSLRTRKRGRASNDDYDEADIEEISFFSNPSKPKDPSKRRRTNDIDSHAVETHDGEVEARASTSNYSLGMSEDDRKRILRQNKIKVTWLNPATLPVKSRRKRKDQTDTSRKEKIALMPQPLRSFNELGPRHGVRKHLLSRVAEQGYNTPTEVQLAAIPLLLDDFSELTCSTQPDTSIPKINGAGRDLLTIAPTGCGKTLAFMIPMIHDIQTRKTGEDERHISALVLAPTKELVGQIVNEGRKLVKDDKLRITQLRKGMRISEGAGGSKVSQQAEGPTVVKADILVSTPGLLQSLLTDNTEASAALAKVRCFVLDEADVLLHPLFREQTLCVWDALSHPQLQVSLWSATMGSNIEELAQSTIERRHRRLSDDSRGAIPQAPLLRLVVGLKDSAVSNIHHKLIYAATEQGKLMGLRQLLHPTSTSNETGSALRPPFLVFTQTIERAIALHSELLYDIPAEAGGIRRIAVLHSDLSDSAREDIMTRFRKGEIWVLITTDLLSRGVDFRGVNGVVNYDMPTSSAAYVHRVGRTGRAGREGGVAVTLYSEEDIPYLKHVANVVSLSQAQEGGKDGVQQWLLDALPKLSKNDKRTLQKRGIESRTARGRQKDPKSARKARISSKAGYIRRVEDRKRGAIQGSRRRAVAANGSNENEGSDFDGFD